MAEHNGKNGVTHERSDRNDWKPGYGGRNTVQAESRRDRSDSTRTSDRGELTRQARDRFDRRNSMTPGTMRSGSPFDLLDEFARDMDSLFDSFGLGRRRRRGFGGYRGGMEGSDTNALQSRSWGMNAGWNPQIEAYYNDEGHIVVSADLPGVKKEDIDCQITKDHVLVISGERKNAREHRDEESGRYMSERSYGTFRRAMQLPDHVDTDGVSASFKDGVLELTINTLGQDEEEDSTTKIEIM